MQKLLCARARDNWILIVEQAPAYLQQRNDGVCLSVKAQPRASRNEIAGALGNQLKIKVTAALVDSAANEALLDFLAEILGCSRNSLELLRGHTSRHKQVLIHGMELDRVAARLAG
jgi:uncharacterized protein